MIEIKLSKEELLLILHALMSAQFPLDKENSAFRLYLKLKESV